VDICPGSFEANLSGRSVATIVVVLCLGGCVRSSRSSQGFPCHFSSFFARLLKVAIVSPEMCSVFATVYEDAAGPCCPDASRVGVILELRLRYLLRSAVVLKLLEIGLGCCHAEGIRDGECW